MPLTGSRCAGRLCVQRRVHAAIQTRPALHWFAECLGLPLAHRFGVNGSVLIRQLRPRLDFVQPRFLRGCQQGGPVLVGRAHDDVEQQPREPAQAVDGVWVRFPFGAEQGEPRQ